MSENIFIENFESICKICKREFLIICAMNIKKEQKEICSDCSEKGGIYE